MFRSLDPRKVNMLEGKEGRKVSEMVNSAERITKMLEWRL